MDDDSGPAACGWIHLAAAVTASHGRLAVNKTEAADMLGVSVEFFDEHVVPEVRCIRRGRRVIFPVFELLLWLAQASDGPVSPM